jgi:hypothetical protein
MNCSAYAHSRCYLPRIPREHQRDTLECSDLRFIKSKVGRAISERMNVTIAQP